MVFIVGRIYTANVIIPSAYPRNMIGSFATVEDRQFNSIVLLAFLLVFD